MFNYPNKTIKRFIKNKVLRIFIKKRGIIEMFNRKQSYLTWEQYILFAQEVVKWQPFSYFLKGGK
jgi:hypothetical protein